MHPEVVSDKPGRCPKCGMALVPSGSKQPHVMAHTSDKGLGVLTWRSYMPLIVIISLIFISALAAIYPGYVSGSASVSDFLLHFMTGFFLVFAGFKLLDLRGFAEGYSTYDLLAQRIFAYGYVYPFIELGFGLLMLSGYHPVGLLWTEFAVMTFSGLGVAIKLMRGEEFMCACLGTLLKVPLTYVTLMEDFGMAALAFLLIIYR